MISTKHHSRSKATFGVASSVTRSGNLLDFGQVLNAFGIT